MKWIRWPMIICLTFFALESAQAGTYSLTVRYQPSKDLSSLGAKIGPTLAMAPFKDVRPDTLYIGRHTNVEGDVTHFRSNPFPLERAIGESLSEALSRYGIKIVPIPSWDEKPESLKNLETDSVLMIEIKKFWSEGSGSFFGTKVKGGVQLVIHLGVKKEGKVFTRTVEVEKEMKVARSTAERVETMMNQMLSEIFDSYFSNPY